MSTAIIGSCGEHYVAAFFAGNGLIVALPRAGTRGSDLFVGAADGGRLVRVQVKTGKDAFHSPKTEGPYYAWDTNLSVIEHHDENLWYAYVWLNGWPQEPRLPEVFLIPSGAVVGRMKTLHGNSAKVNTRPFFWMYSSDLVNYKGEAGLQTLKQVMTPPVNPPVSAPDATSKSI